MKHYIRFPRADGTHSRQAHADLPAGTFEREMGKEGFFGPAAHFHHRHPPTAWVRFSGALNPHAYDLNRLPETGASPWDATPFMHNGDVKIRHWKTSRAMEHLVRNQDGDDLLFIHDGAGEFFCDWGRLAYRDGDYIVIRGIGGWVGVGGLLPVVLLASVQGTVIGLGLIVAGRGQPGPVPGSAPAPAAVEQEGAAPVADADWVPPRNAVHFGPFLAAGALEWLWLQGWLAQAIPALSIFR